MGKSRRGLLVPVTGAPSLVETDGRLDSLQALVARSEGGSGYIDHVRLPGLPNSGMWVDEEGLINGLPVNARATILYRSGGVAGRPLHQGVICGPALLLGEDKYGEPADLDAVSEQAARAAMDPR